MTQKVNVYVELCHPDAKLPKYANTTDAGMDIYAVEDMVIEPNQTVLVKTGLKVAIPEGYEIQIRPRSGISLRTRLRIANSPGTIDAGYRDEIAIIITNEHSGSLADGDVPGSGTYFIKKGDRVAQMVLQRVPQIEWIKIEDIQAIEGDRGGGFGSTGIK